ncbi:MAG: hypothetical protein GX224_04055 [Thermoplasmatales archaeon]|nr:hypothetical protein [Thermoplasmatales archaeon]
MAQVALDWDAITETFMANNGPEILLALIGLLAVSVAVLRIKDGEDGNKYRLAMILGTLVSVLMVYILIVLDLTWTTATLIIVAVACFALIIRPFRKVHFAVILGLMVVCVVYIYLGSLVGFFEPLSTGWPRIIVAFVAGGLCYAIFNFAEAIIDLVGGILNFVPILFILGLICIAEAVCLIYTGDTIYQLYLAYRESSTQALAHW